MKKSIHSPQRGQTLVEFALLVPVFLFLAVVIFDFGRAVYYYSAIHNAAREGARYGAIHPNETEAMKEKAVNYAIGLGITPDNVIAKSGVFDLYEQEAYTVTVIVKYCFVPVTPIVGEFIKPKLCDPTNPCCFDCQDLRFCSESIMKTEAKP
jgi:Flp pilus assembly protein TadG